MSDEVIGLGSRQKSRFALWLFNPFVFLAGYRALFIGLGFILAAGFLGRLGNTHFDGVLDVHKGLQAPLWLFVLEGVVNWLSLAVPLYFFGLIISPSRFRLIDIFGTQALARWPYFLSALVMLPKANERAGNYVLSVLGQAPAEASAGVFDLIIFAVALFVTILSAVWMVALMYSAYTVCCNVKGLKAVITFILALMGAEILSKFILVKLYFASGALLS